MRSDQVFIEDTARDEMFLNDSLEDWRVALPVPRPFRIHDRNRTAFADAETIRFRAQHAALLGQFQLLEPPFEEVPCGKAAILVAAFRIALIAAEKDVAPRDRDTDAGDDLSLGIRHTGSIFNA